MLAELSKQGRHGCGPFRRVLDERALKVASPHPGLLEPRMAGVAKRYSLPTYEYQYRLLDDDRLVAQVDFAYPDLKIAIEVDGFETHGTPAAATAGMDRDHALSALGWHVIHFSWWHVVKRPKYVADRIKELLAARSRAVHG